MKYERLFTPITINGMELKNRIIMPAIYLIYTPDGIVNDRMCEFYNARAEGGAALLIVGGMRFDDYGGSKGMVCIQSDDYLPGLKKMVDGVHARGGKICAQLYHAGRHSRSPFIKEGDAPYSSSSTFSKFSRRTAKEMTVDDIKKVQKDWAEAAVRAQRAGFDAVEIIACTGYLIPQFISEVANKRTDQYGGSLENRCRFGVEVVETVRAAVGPDYPLLMRVAGNEFMPGGGGIPDAVAFAVAAEKAGIDLINVTGGWHESPIPQISGDVPQGGYTYLAQAVKQAVNIPVAASNRLSDPYVAEETLALGKADMVCLGRVLIADPEWPNKVREGRVDEVRRCVACNQGCLSNSFFQKPTECLVNAMASKEYLYKDIKKTAKIQNILVVGGGPGGAEFAIRAAQRGHNVTLWEKEEKTGGQLPLVAVPSTKRDFLHFIKYQATMLKKSGVNFVCGKKATAEDVLAGHYDIVVTATGVIPTKIKLNNDSGKIPVHTAYDVLNRDVMPGKDVVIIGGGTVGCEVAHVLAERGTLSPEMLYFLSIQKAEKPEVIDELLNTSIQKVTIVEVLDQIGSGFDLGTGWPLMKDLDRLKVARHASSSVVAVGEKSVTIEKKDKDGNVRTFDVPCDTIILAVGAKPNDLLYRELEGKVPELYNLGDSKRVAKVITAVQEAMELAMTI